MITSVIFELNLNTLISVQIFAHPIEIHERFIEWTESKDICSVIELIVNSMQLKKVISQYFWMWSEIVECVLDHSPRISKFLHLLLFSCNETNLVRSLASSYITIHSNNQAFLQINVNAFCATRATCISLLSKFNLWE